MNREIAKSLESGVNIMPTIAETWVQKGLEKGLEKGFIKATEKMIEKGMSNIELDHALPMVFFPPRPEIFMTRLSFFFAILPIVFLRCHVCEPDFAIYSITAVSAINGLIEPSGKLYIPRNESITFTISPDIEYSVYDLIVDGVSVGASKSFTFSSINANHSISTQYKLTHKHIKATDPNIVYTGRFNFENTSSITFEWSGSSISALFEGSYCGILLEQIPHLPHNDRYSSSYYNIFIDNDSVPIVLKATSDKSFYEIADNLDSTSSHSITIFKRSEAFCGRGGFKGFRLKKDMKILPPPEDKKRKIQFIGNSITCGYGNEGGTMAQFSSATENCYMAFSSITARNLDAQSHTISFSGKGVHLNSDSTKTMTLPIIYDRINTFAPYPKWDFSSWIPDAVVINLGTNDFGTGRPPDSASFVNEYIDFINTIYEYYPQTTIFCIDGPMRGYMTLKLITSVEMLQNHIATIISNIQAAGFLNIHKFSMSPMEMDGFGSEGHPNVFQHNINAGELSEFIKGIMNW